MARKPVKIQRKVHQDALGEVNKIKEIIIREQDGLKITDNKHYVRKNNRLSAGHTSVESSTFVSAMCISKIIFVIHFSRF